MARYASNLNRFCGIHVHSLTLIISFIGIVLNVGASICSIKIHSHYYISGIVSTLCYLILIVGNLTKSRHLYWPHMILNVLAIIAFIVFGVFMILLAVHIHKGKHYDWMKQLNRNTIKNWSIVGASLYILLAVIQAICWIIVYRDYRYVKSLRYGRQPRTITVPSVFPHLSSKARY